MSPTELIREVRGGRLTEPPCERIEVYEVRAQLGSGGMGEVVRAWDERLKREVAIKRLRRDLPVTAQRRQRLRLEAQAVARLSHPAIVQLFDIVEDGAGNECIVMELLEGRTLADLIAAGEIDACTAIDLARQVADGLSAAHARGLVHRDLKAENVMVDGEGRAKILDFGLAKYRGEQSSQQSLTQEGALIGTFRAMSPEQALGRDADGRSDLYALGILLYEMLLGRTPFTGNSPLDLCQNIVQQRPAPPRVLRPDLPAPVAALIESLLEKDPERRPASAASVAKVLGDLAEVPELGRLGPPPKAVPHPSDALTAAPVPWPETLPASSSTLSKAREFFRSGHRQGVVLALVLTATAVAGLAYRGWGPFAATEPAGRQPLAVGAKDTAAEEVGPERALEIYRQAWSDLGRYYQTESVDRAILGFERVLGSGRMQAAAHAGLARAFWRKYRWRSTDPMLIERADNLACQAIELDSELAIARVSAGLVALERKDHERARRQIEHALVLDPNDPEAHFAVARLENELGDGEAARAAIDEAEALGKDDAELHNLRGSSWYREGAFDAAAQAFDEAAERAPDNIISLRNLGAAYFKLGRHGEAATAIQQALAIQPSGSLYTNLGTLLFYQGLYPQAAVAMEKALTFPSGANSFLNWANLGDVYRQIPGRDDAARDAYRRALDLLEERAGSGELDAVDLSRKLLYLAKRGDAAEALAVLEGQPELAESNDGDVLYRLSQALEILKRRDQALEAVRRALGAGYPLEEIRRDPELIELRGDVRFHRILIQLQEGDLASTPSGERT